VSAGILGQNPTVRLARPDATVTILSVQGRRRAEMLASFFVKTQRRKSSAIVRAITPRSDRSVRRSR
jgi:hypothetical protein